MSYNGWTNYETWNVALYMDNDEQSYALARTCKNYKEYQFFNLTHPRNTTPDGVSLFDPKLNHEELDEKIKELGAQLPSSFILIAMLKLKINTENQAFDQAEGQEVARILRGLADQVEHLDKLQECQLPLRDINGNTVGYYQTWTDQDDQEERQVSSPYATWKNIENVVENALGEYPERLT